MENREKGNRTIEGLVEGLLGQLLLKDYKKGSLYNYRKKFNALKLFMDDNNISVYSSDVGDDFLKDYYINHKVGVSFNRSLRTAIERLNDYNEGKVYSLQRTKEPLQLSTEYMLLLEEYLLFCKKNSNKARTINNKRQFCGSFLNALDNMGCYSIRSIKSNHVCKACLIFKNKDAWAAIRLFLKYLSQENFITSDYSPLVPHYKKPYVLPTTYTQEEVLRFEEAIDRTSKTGIRDYAMLLLAIRLGMRSGDIVRLTLNEINFDSNSIHLLQEKTLNPLELPLLPEIKNAIKDYYENARPNVKEEIIFLRCKAPYQRITTSVLRFSTTKYFHKGNINISDKKHGLHTFRSSLASSMINEDMPYDVVRKILGHTDPDDISKMLTFQIPYITKAFWLTLRKSYIEI